MPTYSQKITKDYALYNGDCVEVMSDLPKESIGLSVFSPPFSSLYAYSSSDEDLGNSKTYSEFFQHFDFVVDALLQITMPGRIVAVHCMDLPTFKGKEGYIGLEDFPGDIIRSFKKVGFIYVSHHCIWKDPLIAATRTKALGLAHKQIVKDSSKTRMGIADYIVAFMKPGDNPVPITHPKGLTEYHGEREIPRELNRFLNWPDPKTNKRSHWIWQQYASPVWMDIRQTKVLKYKKARDNDDQKHICPLQLDAIERCLAIWSHPGDRVLDPFSGVGSVVYAAVRNKRKGVGIELKSSYHRQALRNLKGLRLAQKVSTGFSGIAK